MGNTLNNKKANGLALLPFLVFIVVYMGAGLVYQSKGVDMAFYQFPSVTAMFLAQEYLCEVYRPCCDMWHLDQTDSVTLLNSLFRLPLYGVFVCHFQQQSGLKGTSKTVGTQ